MVRANTARRLYRVLVSTAPIYKYSGDQTVSLNVGLGFSLFVFRNLMRIQ